MKKKNEISRLWRARIWGVRWAFRSNCCWVQQVTPLYTFFGFSFSQIDFFDYSLNDNGRRRRNKWIACEFPSFSWVRSRRVSGVSAALEQCVLDILEFICSEKENNTSGNTKKKLPGLRMARFERIAKSNAFCCFLFHFKKIPICSCCADPPPPHAGREGAICWDYFLYSNWNNSITSFKFI